MITLMLASRHGALDFVVCIQPTIRVSQLLLLACQGSAQTSLKLKFPVGKHPGALLFRPLP